MEIGGSFFNSCWIGFVTVLHGVFFWWFDSWKLLEVVCSKKFIVNVPGVSILKVSLKMRLNIKILHNSLEPSEMPINSMCNAAQIHYSTVVCKPFTSKEKMVTQILLWNWVFFLNKLFQILICNAWKKFKRWLKTELGKYPKEQWTLLIFCGLSIKFEMLWLRKDGGMMIWFVVCNLITILLNLLLKESWILNYYWNEL